MKIPLNVGVLITGFIIAQGLFSSALLLFQKNNAQANRYLSGLMLLFALWLCDTFFNIAEVYQQNPNFYFLPIYYSLAFGPLIFFYTRAITQKDFRWKPKHFWHFLPAILQGMGYVFLQASTYSFRRSFWLEVHQPYTYNLEFYLSFISLAVYLFFSIKMVLNYQRWIKNHFSQTAHINLQWLRLVLSLSFVMASFWLVDALLRTLSLYYFAHSFSAIAMGGCVLVLAAGGLLQNNLKESKIDLEENKNALKIAETAPLDQALLEKIRSEMETHQHYLNPKLTLNEFADLLGLPTRTVSYHLNQGLGMPFIDFTNQYRVAKIQQLLTEESHPHLSLLGIALECGFNSKSTFNRVFKKMTGESPSAYQKKVQNEF